MARQILTLELDGCTAGDYLAHMRDPDPAALDHGLRSVTLRAEPLGTTVEALLTWEGAAPATRVAAQAAGLPLIAEVRSVESREVDAVPPPEPQPHPARRASA
ncbi:MAG: hypothetical protein M3389_01440, partial [Actinomycetota bacterium]|nr:hypothetical protein [Actinomycetota bacterium]